MIRRTRASVANALLLRHLSRNLPFKLSTYAFYEKALGLKGRFAMGGDNGEVETGATALAFASEGTANGNGASIRCSRPSDAQAPAVEIAFVLDDPAVAFEAAVVAAGAHAVKPASKKPWGQTVVYVRDLRFPCRTLHAGRCAVTSARFFPCGSARSIFANTSSCAMTRRHSGA